MYHWNWTFLDFFEVFQSSFWSAIEKYEFKKLRHSASDYKQNVLVILLGY